MPGTIRDFGLSELGVRLCPPICACPMPTAPARVLGSMLCGLSLESNRLLWLPRVIGPWTSNPGKPSPRRRSGLAWARDANSSPTFWARLASLGAWAKDAKFSPTFWASLGQGSQVLPDVLGIPRRRCGPAWARGRHILPDVMPASLGAWTRDAKSSPTFWAREAKSSPSFWAIPADVLGPPGPGDAKSSPRFWARDAKSAPTF